MFKNCVKWIVFGLPNPGSCTVLKIIHTLKLLPINTLFDFDLS